MYLFATQKEMGLYSVFSAGEQSSVGVVDDEAYADEVFEGIPDVGEVAVDSDAAYELARATLPEGFGDTLCNAYLMLSSLEGATRPKAPWNGCSSSSPRMRPKGRRGRTARRPSRTSAPWMRGRGTWRSVRSPGTQG